MQFWKTEQSHGFGGFGTFAVATDPATSADLGRVGLLQAGKSSAISKSASRFIIVISGRPRNRDEQHHADGHCDCEVEHSVLSADASMAISNLRRCDSNLVFTPAAHPARAARREIPSTATRRLLACSTSTLQIQPSTVAQRWDSRQAAVPFSPAMPSPRIGSRGCRRTEALRRRQESARICRVCRALLAQPWHSGRAGGILRSKCESCGKSCGTERKARGAL